MDNTLLLTYPNSLTVCALADGEIVLQTSQHRLSLGKNQVLPLPVIERLQPPGVAYSEFLACAKSAQGDRAEAYVYRYLKELSDHGLLQYVVNDAHRSLATLIPTSSASSYAKIDPATDDLQPAWNHSLVLSRFACFRRCNDQLVVESPLSGARIIVHEQALAGWLMHLVSPTKWNGVADLSAHCSAESAQRFIQMLVWSRVVVIVTEAGECVEDHDESLEGWEFHDLLFHTHSRQGRCLDPLGATYRLANRRAAPPASKQTLDAEPIPLQRPNSLKLQASAENLFEVLDRRCSIRQFGTQPISLQQLGEFLFHAGRIKESVSTEVMTEHGPQSIEFTKRTYPSGGCLYPLELYTVIGNCHGIAPGLYHYDARRHCLQAVESSKECVAKLLTGAGYSIGVSSNDIQVLLILSARFNRMTWKYSALAYSLILKEVGALMQNMYLVATAMHLAPCALGSGDSDLFARAISSDYFSETSVGEFVLGSWPDESTRGSHALTHSVPLSRIGHTDVRSTKNL